MIEKVITEDGSVTFYNSEFDQCYHSKSGALDEALMKHLAPSRKRILEGSVILDFCFGLGYNSLVAMKYARENGFKIRVVAIENDLEIIRKMSECDFNEFKPELDLINSVLSREPLDVCGVKVFNGSGFVLLLGDARDSLEVLNGDVNFDEMFFDVVFFDPFSRQVCPYLWEEEIFQKIYNQMSGEGILTTYSCSKAVRKNMSNAGFEVKDGPIVGRKSPGTLGIKT